MKIIKIKTCCECPHYPGSFGLDENIQQPACEQTGRHIENAKQIPEWCPLETIDILINGETK